MTDHLVLSHTPISKPKKNKKAWLCLCPLTQTHLIHLLITISWGPVPSVEWTVAKPVRWPNRSAKPRKFPPSPIIVMGKPQSERIRKLNAQCRLAVTALTDGEFPSIRAASRHYNIPFETLRARVHGGQTHAEVTKNFNYWHRQKRRCWLI